MKQVILLVGCQASGKTTYCQEHLKGYTRISQDDMGREGHREAYDKALENGDELIVIDRINHTREQRGNYIAKARKAGYRVKLVWFNVDRNLCLKRAKERKGHPTLPPEKADEAINFFFKAFQTPSKKEADEVEVIGQPPYYVPVRDICEEIGDRRFIIIGDVHGTFDELKEMLEMLKFNEQEDVLISTGDLVDRGPKVKETLEFVMKLPRFYSVMGNHEDKAIRHFAGNRVKIANGLQVTIESFNNKRMPPETLEFLQKLPLILKTPAGYVVHAGFDPLMSPEEQQKSDCIYMRYYGGRTYFDAINGKVWYDLWPKDNDRIFFGHIPQTGAELGFELPNIKPLDGGCVFGGYLKAWDSKDGIIYYVKAKETYSVSEYATATENSIGDEIKKREEYVIAGLLRRDKTDDGQFSIFTYTDQCVYDNAWDEITINSRGHIFDNITGKRVACTFSKFFNLDENQSSLFESFDWTQPYEIYTKMDGWLGVLFRHEKKFKVASRGSFHSAGSEWATNHIQKFDLSCLPETATLVFEIISKQQKIILDYPEDTLVILAAFDFVSGKEYSREVVEGWAKKIGLPIVKKHDKMTIKECLEIQKTEKGIEGFVIRFADGRRVKVKTEWYLELAKLLSKLSPISIWEAMINGKVKTESLIKVPEEHRAVANQYASFLECQYSKVYDYLLEESKKYIAKYKGDKKQMGLNASKELKRCIFDCVFEVLKMDNEVTRLADTVSREKLFEDSHVYIVKCRNDAHQMNVNKPEIVGTPIEKIVSAIRNFNNTVMDIIYPAANEFVSLKAKGLPL